MAVLYADYKTTRVKLYNDAKVDAIDVSMKKTVVKIVYKGLNNIGAPVYNNMFNYNISSCDLRSSDALLAIVLNIRTKFGEYNLAYRGPVYRNSLPLHIKACPTFELFKAALKNYGFHNQV